VEAFSSRIWTYSCGAPLSVLTELLQTGLNSVEWMAYLWT
jgi:hypothetical protein